MNMTPFRLPLESGKYAYIEVKAVFSDSMEVHILDRTNVKSGVSIIDCIEEVQEAIINEFGAKDFVMKFLQHSKWFLYSKHGKFGDYRTIEGVRELQAFDPALDQKLVAIAMERSAELMPVSKAKKSTNSSSTKQVKKVNTKKVNPIKSTLVTMPTAAMFSSDLVVEQLTLF